MLIPLEKGPASFNFTRMKQLYVCFLLICLSCGEKKDTTTIDKEVNGKAFTTVDFEGYETYLKKVNTPVVVVNFWATWCKPCIKELPYFEKLGREYRDNVSVVLVSLDFPDQIERLEQFITKHKLQSEVVLLDDGNANEWIPKVDQDWSGAIPATIIINEDKRSFFEQSFTYEELEKQVKTFL